MAVTQWLQPTGKCHLLTRVELNAFRPLNVQVSEKGAVPSCKRKPSHRRRDTDINANHASIEVITKFASRKTVVGEDRGKDVGVPGLVLHIEAQLVGRVVPELAVDLVDGGGVMTGGGCS